MTYNPDYPPKPNKENNEGKQERKDWRLEKVREMTRIMVEKINQEYQGLLEADGKISMDSFIDEVGDNGPVKKSELEMDRAMIREKEEEFSHADDPEILKIYKVENKEERIKQWREEKEKNINTQAEMVITFLLHKFLGDRFLIVRASEFDDYENGVDTLIIDKNTGEVIGAFDEVLDSFHLDEVAVRESKKYIKVGKKNIKGGAKTKYGATFYKEKDDKKPELIRQKLSNVPMFYLSLTKSDFEKTLREMDMDLEKEPSATEREIFIKLLNSLKEQAALFRDIPQIAGKISKFEKKIDGFLQK